MQGNGRIMAGQNHGEWYSAVLSSSYDSALP